MPPQLAVTRTTPAPAPTGDIANPQQGTLTITDNVIFRWARIPALHRLIPNLHAVRNLEYRMQTYSCHSCRSKPPQVDHVPLEIVRKFLATCPDNTANLVKKAAGILNYTVGYIADNSNYREVTR
jgi:hypothetical protein